MKHKFLKLTGVLSIVAVMGLSSFSTSNAQSISINDVGISTVENLDQTLLDVASAWTFVSPNYVYEGPDKPLQ